MGFQFELKEESQDECRQREEPIIKVWSINYYCENDLKTKQQQLESIFVGWRAYVFISMLKRRLVHRGCN